MTCGWMLWVHRTTFHENCLFIGLFSGNGTEAVILSNGDYPPFIKDYILYFSDNFCKKLNDR